MHRLLRIERMSGTRFSQVRQIISEITLSLQYDNIFIFVLKSVLDVMGFFHFVVRICRCACAEGIIHNDAVIVLNQLNHFAFLLIFVELTMHCISYFSI
mmetsp:Transcript_49357/g.154800  ORF Transcript_49357/g.154800 Transcript_49357/m.154800 type:complete len:99 (+) Transcript_49357:443-739(+)